MSWTLGQAWPQIAPSSGTVKTISGPAPSTTGRLLVLWIWFSGNTTIASITDNAVVPNTYTFQGFGSSGNHQVAIYTAPIASIPASGNLTITVTITVLVTNLCLAATEYNGQNAVITVDPVSVIQDGKTTWITQELFTTVYTDTLVVAGVYGNANTTITVGTGFTSRGINSTGEGAADSLGTVIPAAPVALVPFNAVTQTGNTSYCIVALVASDSVQQGKNPPAATAPVVNQYARGLFGLSNVDSSAAVTAALPLWTQANMSGYAPRFSWKVLEPSPGVYNWAPVDQVLQLAAQYNKYVSLSAYSNPAPGSGISKQPAWLGPMGCSTYTYWNGANTVGTVGFAPWDPIFLAYWTQFIRVFGARYDGNPYISYIATDSGVGDGEAYITRGTNGLAQLNALGGVQIWVNAIVKGYWPAYFGAFRQTQVIFQTGQPVPGDFTTMPQMLAYGTGQYGAQFGFRSDGLSPENAPADFFQTYTAGHPVGFQFAAVNDPGLQAIQETMANGYLLAGNVSQLGGQFFELYQGQYTDGPSQPLYTLYGQLLFGPNPPIIPPAWVNPPRMLAGGGGGDQRAFPFNRK